MARKPQVKCPVCEQYFYREDCNYINFKKRYYHQECYEVIEEKDKIIYAIQEKMKKILKDNYSQAKITRQINAYLKEGKTPQGILLTIEYWYDYKNSDPTKANGGIGIVGYIYEEALKYFEEKEKRENVNKDIDISQIESKTYTVYPSPITKPKRVRLFDLK